MCDETQYEMEKNSVTQKYKFLIVDLYCNDSRYGSIVSESWLTKQTEGGDQFCYWPSHIQKLDKLTLNKLLLAHHSPDINWSSYKAKLRGTFGNIYI